MKVVDIS